MGGLFPITNVIYSVSERDCGRLIAKLSYNYLSLYWCLIQCIFAAPSLKKKNLILYSLSLGLLCDVFLPVQCRESDLLQVLRLGFKRHPHCFRTTTLPWKLAWSSLLKDKTPFGRELIFPTLGLLNSLQQPFPKRVRKTSQDK